ncbi:hypothetical protein [Bradyrhizobium sp. CCBAU 53415]|uniref:hypothetical protein n=1 Tax=Bradyrhizobium sp. CCBAU 53415 TaxID=1325119 RepID=UPI002305CFAD|nr:hypothetical protein [Bradyrhizobium sp. CCBAU 53415]MDA9465341.1 hypothetical protein [Bradyrhizobium sp. CCBAU 53415]
MSATFVSAWSERQISGASSFSISLSLTAGNSAVLIGSQDKGSPLPTSVVTDGGTGSDAFTLTSVTGTSASSFRYFVYFLPTLSDSRTGVTLTWASGVPFADAFLWQFSGLASPVLDAGVVGTGSGSGDVSTSSTGTLASADEFAVVYGCSAVEILAVPSPWTSDGRIPDTGSRGGHQILTANTAIQGTVTNDSGEYVVVAATFKGASGTDVLMPQIWM